jgi:hypothetical protein
LKNKTLVGALKFIEKKRNEMKRKKAGYFLSTFGRQRFDY